MNIQRSLILTATVFYSLGLSGINAQEIKDFTPYQQNQIQELQKLNFDELGLKEYGRFRSVMTELATNNPERTLDLTISMLTEVDVYKRQPEVHFLFSKSVELNLAIMFTLLANANEIPLNLFLITDLRARFDGIGSKIENPKEAELAAKLYKDLIGGQLALEK
jgi:hypothetical protein